MTALKGIHIDVDRRLAWAGAGLTAREYTTAAAAHGLATPFGDTGSVGIAGLTLGGGIGWLVRKYGLAIDALRAVEIVTADGRILTASEDEHADLFWAVRGGGGNFGIVTRFQFELYPVPAILGGALFLPPTPEVLRSLQPLAEAAPEELTTISFLMHMPAGAVRAGVAGRSARPRGHVRLRRRSGRRRRGARAVPPGRDAARRAGRPDALPGHLPDARRCGAARPRDRPLALPRHHRRRRRRRDARRHGERRVTDGDGPDPHPRWGHGPRPGRRHRVRPSRAPT